MQPAVHTHPLHRCVCVCVCVFIAILDLMAVAHKVVSLWCKVGDEEKWPEADSHVLFVVFTDTTGAPFRVDVTVAHTENVCPTWSGLGW